MISRLCLSSQNYLTNVNTLSIMYNMSCSLLQLYETVSQKREVHNWTEKLKLWLKELSVFKKSLLYNDNALDEQTGVNQVQNAELPIWLAAQRAVARYEGILSPVGPRERLLRRLLSWIGLIPATPETPFQVENDGDSPEPYLRFDPQTALLLLSVISAKSSYYLNHKGANICFPSFQEIIFELILLIAATVTMWHGRN